MFGGRPGTDGHVNNTVSNHTLTKLGRLPLRRTKTSHLLNASVKITDKWAVSGTNPLRALPLTACCKPVVRIRTVTQSERCPGWRSQRSGTRCEGRAHTEDPER